MKIIIRSQCTGEPTRANIAVITLTDGDLAAYAHYRDAFLEQEARAQPFAMALTHMVYRAINCVWYDDFDEESEKARKVLGDDVVHALIGDDFAFLPEEVTLDGHYAVARTDSDKVYVNDDGLFWEAYLRHVDNFPAETWLVTWNILMCETHGWRREDAQTCLTCMAET